MSEHNKLPSRAEIEEVIAGFAFPYDWTVIRQKIAAYNERRSQSDFEYSTDPEKNPYVELCHLSAARHQIYLSQNDVDSFRVGNRIHLYLLIPYRTDDGNTDILIFDPTAEQFFKGLEHPYFLGTKDEFLDLGDRLSTEKPIEEIYFKGINIRARYPKSYEDRIAHFPQDLYNLVGNFFDDKNLRYFRLCHRGLGYSFIAQDSSLTTAATSSTGISEVSKAARSTILPTTGQR